MADRRSKLANEAEEAYGDPKTLAEDFKERSAERRATRADPQPPGAARPARPPSMIPMPGDEEGIAAAVAGDMQAADFDAQYAATEVRNWEKLNETYQVYLRCPVKHPKGRPNHALYLKEYPRDTNAVAYDGWRSRQKPTFEEAYYPLEVMCQSCLMGEVHTAAKCEKTSPQGALKLEQRHVYRFPKDPARFAVEGESRVFNTSHISANQGRLDAMARARAAGYEVYDE